MKHDWFYMKGADKHGPVRSSKLRELAKNGQLLPTDLVWREGMNDWKRPRKIAGLFDAVSQSPKQAPPSKRPPTPPSNLLGNVAATAKPTGAHAQHVVRQQGDGVAEQRRTAKVIE